MVANIPIELVLRALPELSRVEPRGRGGFKCTFRGDLDGRTVAVQVHDPAKVSRVRLDREIEAMLSVDSPNVARLLEVKSFSDGGRVYPVFICEYVHGTTLNELVESGCRFTDADAVRLAVAATRGLSAIHASRLIHRDIKPENVMIRARSGDPVILDLGVAKHLDKETLTPTGVQPGTRVWMAPEQLRGDKFIDARADLFALGLTLYFAASGEYPFSEVDVTEGILETEAPTLEQSGIHVPPQFSQLVSKLMTKKPFARPRSSRAVLEELVQMQGEH